MTILAIGVPERIEPTFFSRAYFFSLFNCMRHACRNTDNSGYPIRVAFFLLEQRTQSKRAMSHGQHTPMRSVSAEGDS
jgi:hypothetical protein